MFYKKFRVKTVSDSNIEIIESLLREKYKCAVIESVQKYDADFLIIYFNYSVKVSYDLAGVKECDLISPCYAFIKSDYYEILNSLKNFKLVETDRLLIEPEDIGNIRLKEILHLY